jgi:hypothetical protein
MCQNSKILALSLILLLLVTPVFGESKTVKSSTRGSIETLVNIRETTEPGFLFEVGGDVFTALFSLDAVRYIYDGEWFEYAADGHLSSTGVYNDNQLILSNYWKQTDVVFTVKEWGVKVDIVLKSKQAPTSFTFHTSQSAGWDDSWIRPVFAYSSDLTFLPVDLTETVGVGTLTYIITEDISNRVFPVIIDPTFDIAASLDDTYSRTQDIDAQGPTSTFGLFGHTTVGGPTGAHQHLTACVRYITGIPRASRFTASNFSFKAANTLTYVGWSAYVHKLNKDNKWEGANAFATSNYADGTAIEAIPKSSTYDTWAISATWTLDNWYDSDDISNMVELAHDDPEYDPSDSEDKYVGFAVYLGTSAGNDQWRSLWLYDNAAADAPELDLTYDPWGEVRVGNGMKYDKNLGVYRYFDY